MRPSWRTLGVAVLVVGIVVAFALRGTSSGDSPEHRTDSDAANGASALPQVAERLGHPVTTLTDGFAPDLGIGAVFVLSPSAGFSRDEARRASDYVTGGGVLVYAAEQGDPQLDLTLHVARQRAIASGDAVGAGPMLAGVGHVAGAVTAQPLDPAPGQVVLLRSASGQPIAIEQLAGRGRLVVLADPLPLTNGHLDQADNWRLAADLVSLAPAGARIAFDEYHHGVAGLGSPLTGWLSTAWGAAVAWAVLVGFVGLLLRGRAFGPRLELPGGGHRSSAEHVMAVGGLLERSHAAATTGRLLAAAARRALAARHGLAVGPDFDRALRQRAPADAAELERALAEMEAGGDAALLAAARRLHHLAYPDQPL
ncbi:MAG TPA: DUF4350 domain-containing protein [Candidatus Dormibacteraeota bacterium]|nr:DUF4350 domain-containing protein [Candidatus Dormibacteraeota bacterium]